jgi:hypothetical protein
MSSLDNNVNINSELSDTMNLKIRIKDLQRDRIKADKEKLLLKNRINLLRMEEEKVNIFCFIFLF